MISTGSYYLYANVENLTLNNAPLDLFGVGNELANAIAGDGGVNLLLGGDGADTIDGGGNTDWIFGETGDDTLYGGTGVFSDVLLGGAGNDMLDGSANPLTGQLRNQGDGDYMFGGTGDDTYYVDTQNDLTFEAVGEGVDTVFAQISGDGYYLYAEVENLTLLTDTLYGVGNELNNTLIGSDATNWLLGGAGNDTLNGGAGADVLFGEAGADIFQFNANSGQDLIGDFEDGVDTIHLQGTVFADFGQIEAAGALFALGDTAMLSFGGGRFVVIQGVALANLTAADFSFG